MHITFFSDLRKNSKTFLKKSLFRKNKKGKINEMNTSYYTVYCKLRL